MEMSRIILDRKVRKGEYYGMRKSDYPKEAISMGQKVRKKRMDLGLSLDDLAKMTGITGSYLSRIEADKQHPAPEIAASIAKALNEDVFDYFMGSIAEMAIKAFDKCPKESQLNLAKKMAIKLKAKNLDFATAYKKLVTGQSL
jgi:transcriptional regulator with XRE-family HTH domain